MVKGINPTKIGRRCSVELFKEARKGFFGKQSNVTTATTIAYRVFENVKKMRRELKNKILELDLEFFI
jgi:hypothetical protein